MTDMDIRLKHAMVIHAKHDPEWEAIEDHRRVTYKAVIEELKEMAEYVTDMSSDAEQALRDRARELQKQMI